MTAPRTGLIFTIAPAASNTMAGRETIRYLAMKTGCSTSEAAYVARAGRKAQAAVKARPKASRLESLARRRASAHATSTIPR